MGSEQPSSIRTSVRKRVATDGDWSAVPTSPKEFLEVQITTTTDGLGAVEGAIADAGGGVSASFSDTIIANVPAGKISGIASRDDVLLVGENVKPREHVPPENISEGVEITRADELHDEGITGTDTTIAVLDSAFDTSNEKYADQIVGEIGPSGYFSASGAHGDLVTEIVSDMAPDANIIVGTVFGQSILTTMNTLEQDFPEVDAATMSVGYYPQFRIDGLDPISQRIAQFTEDNRLFTTSAGNESGVKNAWQWDSSSNQAVKLPQLDGSVWHGMFTDTAGNSKMEFDSRLSEPERLPIGTPLSTSELDGMNDSDTVGWLAIHWDEEWAVDDARYEARLYESENDSIPVQDSLTVQPWEELVPEAQWFDDGDDHVWVEIQKVDADDDHYFDVWTWGDLQVDYYFDPSTEAPLYANDRCIGIPATSQDEETLSIAAVQAVDVETTGLAFEKSKGDLKGYSSQGPTQDGRQGIDLAGPAHVSTLARGPVEDVFGFNGTSAAAPHVGGGVALMGDLEGVTLDEIKTSMMATGTGIPDGDVGAPPNKKIGDGYLDVYAAAQETTGDYDVSVENSVDVPDRTVIIDDPDIGEFEFTVSAIGRRSPGDTITVNVSAIPTAEYQLELWDRELNTVDTSSVLTGNATTTFTAPSEPGSYAIAAMQDGDAQAMVPVVVEAYSVEITSAPSTIDTQETLTVQADLTTIDGSEAINDVMLGVMSADSDTGASTSMTEVDTTNDIYEGSVSNLDADEYDMGVVVQGEDQVNINIEGVTVEENFTSEEELEDSDTDISDVFSDNANEAIGFSDVADLTVEVAAGDELAQQWSVSRPDRPQFSTAEVGTEVAYLAGLDNSVEARWRDSGDQKWSVSRGGELSDSSPVLSHGMVLIGSGGGTFYGLDQSDGTSQFTVDAGSAVTSTAAVMNDMAFFGANDGNVHAVDLTSASGSTAPMWSTNVGGPIYSALAAGSGMVFVTTNDGDIVGLNAGDGSEAWRINEGAEFGASSPVYWNGGVYVAGTAVYHLDPGTGAQVWSSVSGGTVGASPTVDNGVVYHGDADGTFVAFNDEKNGTAMWFEQFSTGIATKPALTADRVLVGTLDGKLRVVDRTTGSRIASKDLGDTIRSGPVVDNGQVYVGTEGGTVFVLETIP